MINKKVLNLRCEYKSLTDKIESLTKQQDNKLRQLQSKCNHPIIAETDYETYTFFNASPPIRICEICGYEEEGWGSGYKKLNKNDSNIRQVDKEEFYKLSYKFRSDE